MAWDSEVKELERRRYLAKQQGGAEGVARQHAKGRMTIRERVDVLLDPGSFKEHGRATASPVYDDNGELIEYVPANYVVGFGEVNGRRIVAAGEDFTLKGGSPNAAGLRKSVYAEHLASQYKSPLVRLLEGGGGSVKGSGKQGGTVGEPVFSEPRFKIISDSMGQIPIASAALGAVAGFPAGRLVASHFSVMTEHTSQVLIGGPALVTRALGVEMTKDQLGGADIHLRSGVVDNVARDEHDAIEQIKRFLSYLPSNVWERTQRTPCDDPVDRMEQDLLTVVPRDSNAGFEMRSIIEMVVDKGSFFETAALYGPSQICGFARLAGQPVGILANDCLHYAGAMTAEAAQKYRRFVELCDTFHIPVVNLVDQPGFMIGPEAEKTGCIRYGMSAVAAATQSEVPWATVAIHKSFGVASAAHFAPNTYKLAWPSYEMGALPVEGGVAVAFHREIANADNPEQKRRELEDKLLSERSPTPLMESFALHELIDPRDTRSKLCDWLDWVEPGLADLKGPTNWGYRP